MSLSRGVARPHQQEVQAGAKPATATIPATADATVVDHWLTTPATAEVTALNMHTHTHPPATAKGWHIPTRLPAPSTCPATGRARVLQQAVHVSCNRPCTCPTTGRARVLQQVVHVPYNRPCTCPATGRARALQQAVHVPCNGQRVGASRIHFDHCTVVVNHQASYTLLVSTRSSAHPWLTSAPCG